MGGHSSYGHYVSLGNWHSKYLNSDNVKYSCYIGINDVSLLKNEESNTNKIFNLYEKSQFTVFKKIFKRKFLFCEKDLP